MSADTLTITSRNFFERTKVKLALSIVTAAFGLFLLGFCSAAGGLSASNDQLNNNVNDDHVSQSYENLSGGYGIIL